jgi:DNA-3-methyladenine glycosylase II
MVFTKTLTFSAVAPFNFDLSAEIFGHGDKQVRFYEKGRFSQILRVNGKLVQINVSSIGTVDQPKLHLEIAANQPLTLDDQKKTEAAVKYIFNLDSQLNQFYLHVKNDPVMSKLTQKLYGLKNPTTPTVFESLVDSIVEQQISIKVAIQIETRLTKKFGETLSLNGETFFVFPTPKNIAEASLADVQSAGLSLRKAEYIWNAAKMIEAEKLGLENLKTVEDPQQIIEVLDAVRGIGVWTAELTMLRGMQKLDALPADDFGIRRVISKFYCDNKPIKSAEARKIGSAWGNWKGLAAFYLIIAESSGLTL